MADVRHNLVVDTSQSQMSLRQMREEMKRLQIEMSKTSDPTRFAQLEKEFAILRNDMKDTSKAMKYLDPGELLGGWVKMAQGAVGGFAAITGAMSLFGVENENLQEIEKKSMVLIQTMMGLEQARQLLIDGGGKAEQKTLLKSTIGWLGKTLGITKNTAATAANTTATVVQTTATGAQTVATGGATIATRLLGAAMKALPIFAIIGGIAAIVGAVSSLISANKEAAQAQAELNEAGNKYNEISRDLSNSVNKYKDDVKRTALDHKLAMGEMTQNEYDHAKNTQDMLDSLDDVRLKYSQSMVASETVANKEREIEATRFNAQIDRLRRTDFATEQDRQDAINLAYKQHNEKLVQINTNRLARLLKDQAEYDKAKDAAEKKRQSDNEEADKKEAERQAEAAKRAWEERKRNLEQAAAFVYKIDYDSLTEREKIWEDFDKNTWTKAEEYLKKGLITQEEYDRVMIKSKEKYFEKLDALDEKYATEAENAARKHQNAMLDIQITSYENLANSSISAEEKLAAEIEAAKLKADKNKLQADINYNDAVKAADEKLKQDLKNVTEGDIEAEKKAKEAHYTALQNAAEEYGTTMKNITDTTNNEIEAKNKEFNDKTEQDARDLKEALINLKKDTANTNKERLNAELESLDFQMEEELKLFEGNEEAKKLIEEKYIKLRKSVNEEYVKELIQSYSSAYQQIFSSVNTLMSALSERELIGIEANSRKGLEIRKKVAKQQLAMQVAMSAGLIAAGVLQAIAETGVAAPVVAAGLISLGATQVAAILKAQNAIDQIDIEIANLADGGFVMGRGGPRSDSVHANLSNGEFVLNAAAVERLGLNLVNSLNKGASTAALIDYDLLAEKINEKQVYVTDRAITERQRTTKVTEKRTRL